MFSFLLLLPLHEKKNFRLTKICERAVKTIFSLVFAFLRFTEISYFLRSSSNGNVRKQHLSANAYFSVNMKFLYAIAESKDEMSYYNKNKPFLSQLFVDNI